MDDCISVAALEKFMQAPMQYKQPRLPDSVSHGLEIFASYAS
jgi:hypothetical protein